MLIGLGDKEHNDCKLSFPRRRESSTTVVNFVHTVHGFFLYL
ncbi:hypothetical protein [Candidatus Tisiphia endosymbiont of Hybos culiciformis]